MAHRLDKDGYICDVDNLTNLLASSQLLKENSARAWPKKVKAWNKLEEAESTIIKNVEILKKSFKETGLEIQETNSKLSLKAERRRLKHWRRRWITFEGSRSRRLIKQSPRSVVTSPHKENKIYSIILNGEKSGPKGGKN